MVTHTGPWPGPWLPDGKGLDPFSRQVQAEHGTPVHLRLTSPAGHARGGCDLPTSLGQFWSGDPSEVTCPACLEAVHA